MSTPDKPMVICAVLGCGEEELLGTGLLSDKMAWATLEALDLYILNAQII